MFVRLLWFDVLYHRTNVMRYFELTQTQTHKHIHESFGAMVNQMELIASADVNKRTQSIL